MRVNLNAICDLIRAHGSDIYGPNKHAVWNATCFGRMYLGDDLTESETAALVFGHAHLEWCEDQVTVRVVRDKPEHFTKYIAGLQSR